MGSTLILIGSTLQSGHNLIVAGVITMIAESRPAPANQRVTQREQDQTLNQLEKRFDLLTRLWACITVGSQDPRVQTLRRVVTNLSL